MNTRLRKAKKSFWFITPFKLDEHTSEVENALHIEHTLLTKVLSDQLAEEYTAALDTLLNDCINVTKKASQISFAYLSRGNLEVETYINQARDKLDAMSKDIIDRLTLKRNEYVAVFKNELSQAQSTLLFAKGYEPAIILSSMQKSIIKAILNTADLTDYASLSLTSEYSLDGLQKRVHRILKEAKGRKKEMVHTIKSNLTEQEKALLFLDKHGISFTYEAYQMETDAQLAKSHAQSIWKTLVDKKEASLHQFENKLFYQELLQQLRLTASSLMQGLIQLRDQTSRQDEKKENLGEEKDKPDETSMMTKKI